MESTSQQITDLLKDWSAGDKSALDKLMPLVYGDLRRIAQKRLANEREGHTLQATALVHEAYLRLVDFERVNVNDRVHFFAVCARLMRRILVDAARSRNARKRGADLTVVELNEALGTAVQPGIDLIALDDALDALAVFDWRKSQVLELRIFGGLNLQETADILQISTDTVTRDMHFATVWLRRELSPKEARDTRTLA